MDIYKTEAEQISALKDLWKKNGNAIIWAVVAIFVMVGGVRYWKHHQHVQVVKVSNAYFSVLSALQQQDLDNVKLRGEALLAQGSQRNPYPYLTAFLLAKLAIDEEDFSAAVEKLQWVLNAKGVPEVWECLARARLARIYRIQGKHEQALALLDGKQEKEYESLFESIKGDIYHDLNDLTAARNAFQKSMTLESQDEINAPWQEMLQLKIDDLGS